MPHYTRRDFLRMAGSSAAALGMAWNASAGANARRKPNFIVILADDLGYGDLGCYGSMVNGTPHIDALAAGGVRFTDFHSNGPMCTPTRGALLTGRYQHRYGMERVLGSKGPTYLMGMPLEAVTVAEHLQPAGYVAGVTGKWHLGYILKYNPVRQGFGFFRGHVSGAGDYHSHIDRTGREDWWWNDELHMETGYSTHLINRHSLEFIEQHRDEPFCLYVSHSAVHFPWQGPNDKADRVKGGDYWSDAKYGSRTDRKAALTEMIAVMDEGVGQIVARLRELGLEEHTLIFFASDNGGHKFVSVNEPLRGNKGSVYEGGHRVPAIAYWPGTLKPGTVCRETVMTMDLLPTLLALCDLPLLTGDQKLDGVNILPTLLTGEPMPARTLFWRIKAKKAVRKGPWKLVIEDGPAQLFNLDEDLSETTDLAGGKPELLEALLGELADWERDVDSSAAALGVTNEW